jgi:hypothetical protein
MQRKDGKNKRSVHLLDKGNAGRRKFAAGYKKHGEREIRWVEGFGMNEKEVSERLDRAAGIRWSTGSSVEGYKRCTTTIEVLGERKIDFENLDKIET